MIASPVQSLLAQERGQTGDPRNPINRGDGGRAVVTSRNVQQLRSELNNLFDETEAAFVFFAQYSIAQDSAQALGQEDLSGVMKRLAEIRAEFASYSDNSLLLLSEGFPDSATMGRLTNILRKVRTDAEYKASLDKAEKWFISSKNHSSVAGAPGKAGVRSTPSAPSFTRPVCNFYNLVDFPSAVDIGIAKGVLLAVEIIINSLNPSVGNNAPNPAYYVAVIAKGISKAIVVALDGARDAGLWCQDIAFYMQGATMTDGLFFDAILFPPSSGGYLEFLKDILPALISKAQEKNIPINCANARLAEANNFYNQGKWADAYKKYRTAYSNIGAAECQAQ